MASGVETLSFHAAFRGEPFDEVDVSLAPDAPRFARCEAHHVTLVVARLPDPVDPSVAQRFIDRVFPGHGRLVRRLLVIAHLEVVGRRVVLFEPRSEVGGCGEEGRYVLGHARNLPIGQSTATGRHDRDHLTKMLVHVGDESSHPQVTVVRHTRECRTDWLTLRPEANTARAIVTGRASTSPEHQSRKTRETASERLERFRLTGGHRIRP